MVTNFGQFKKAEMQGRVPTLKTVPTLLPFLVSFENINYFFDIPSYPLPIVVRNSLTNQFYQKNLRFRIISKKKEIQV